MTDTMTSHNIGISSWDTLYIQNTSEAKFQDDNKIIFKAPWK